MTENGAGVDKGLNELLEEQKAGVEALFPNLLPNGDETETDKKDNRPHN